MNIFLMYPARDFDADAPLPPNADDLMRDLDLDILLSSAARGDGLVYATLQKALLLGAPDAATIRYRQAILGDCIREPGIPRRLYDIARKAVDARRGNWFWFGSRSPYPETTLHGAMRMVDLYIPILRELRKAADQAAGAAESAGLTRLFAELRRELSEEYLSELEAHLRYLNFTCGAVISAELGAGLEARAHALMKPHERPRNLLRRLTTARERSYVFSVNPRDEAGCRILGELRDRGLNGAADALARSADHIEAFFKLLLTESSFYLGSVALLEELTKLGEPWCMPEPIDDGGLGEEFRGLYYPCLSLHAGRRSVGNDADALGPNPVIVTGANEGGKSTFLRSVGVAQLMLGAGMFAPAAAYRSSVSRSVHTHYRRREDRDMRSGKLDEELVRMDQIAARLRPGDLMLFNESFSATNEREGGEIANQITRALIERGVRVYFVTHLYSFAAGFEDYAGVKPLLMKAERRGDGSRSFKISPGVPARRSHGDDLYRAVFDGLAEGGAGTGAQVSPKAQPT